VLVGRCKRSAAFGSGRLLLCLASTTLVCFARRNHLFTRLAADVYIIDIAPKRPRCSVVGFFVGDELVSGKKITWTDISTALAMLNPIKQRYPQLFVWQNEGGTGWESHLPNGKLPAEVDVISIDDYGLSPNATREWYRTTLYVYPESHSLCVCRGTNVNMRLSDHHHVPSHAHSALVQFYESTVDHTNNKCGPHEELHPFLFLMHTLNARTLFIIACIHTRPLHAPACALCSHRVH
jgi:hypothetical protein